MKVVKLENALGLPRIAMISTHGYVAAIPPLGAADTGGQVVYVLELSKKLAQFGFAVDVWTRQFGEQPAVEVVDERVRILRAPCGGTGFIPKEYLYEVLGEWKEHAFARIQREKLHYQFINSHYWDGGIAGQRLAAALGVPHVHTPHSLGSWKRRQMLADYPDGAAKFESTYNFGRRIAEEQRLYASSELVIATTADQVEMLSADYQVPADKLRMIPPGYDDARFYPVSNATREVLRRRLGFEGKVVLSLGRLARNKGYDLLIRAFAEVAAREQDARLHLAVGGETLEPAERHILSSCQQLAQQLGIAERVTFAGFVPDEEMADLYRAADVFVMPSRYEPFGMTAVEAMACGTPTVVTTHGGLFRVLKFGVSGLFADPLDPADLGITILKVLKHAALAERLARHGSQTARSRFTWTGVAQELCAAVARPGVAHAARKRGSVRVMEPAAGELLSPTG